MGHQEQGSGSSSQKLGAIMGPTHLGVKAQEQFSFNLHLIPPLWTPLLWFLVSWRPRQQHFPHTLRCWGSSSSSTGKGCTKGELLRGSAHPECVPLCPGYPVLRNKIELRPGREVKKDVWYKFVMAVKVSQNPPGRERGCG